MRAIRRTLDILARGACLALLALACGATASTAHAQVWPSKPIRLIVPYPPGGQTDIVGRWLGSQLTPVLGQNIVIENRAGAGGIIGMSAAKTAAADGYTFVYSNVSISLINRFAHAKLPYDVLTDFEPVSVMGYTTLGLAVLQNSDFRTLEDLIGHVKSNPGKTTFASFGIGSSAHMYGEMLNAGAGLDMSHVPYKGTAPATQDLLAGRVTAAYLDFSSTGPLIESGKFRVLAVTGTKRWPAYPDVPTFGERGFPLDLPGWAGIMAPKDTPKAAVDRMAREIARLVQSPEGSKFLLERGGIIAVGNTPAEFAAMLKRDAPRWGEAFRRSGVKPQE